MHSKLYVGNLSYNVTSDQLATHVGEAGTVVDSVVITEQHSGRSKGFGFVGMSSPEEAFQFYNSLKSGKAVSIEITRRGKKKMFTYDIQ